MTHKRLTQQGYGLEIMPRWSQAPGVQKYTLEEKSVKISSICRQHSAASNSAMPRTVKDGEGGGTEGVGFQVGLRWPLIRRWRWWPGPTACRRCSSARWMRGRRRSGCQRWERGWKRQILPCIATAETSDASIDPSI
jgi:hypothetical protein